MITGGHIFFACSRLIKSIQLNALMIALERHNFPDSFSTGNGPWW